MHQVRLDDSGREEILVFCVELDPVTLLTTSGRAERQHWHGDIQSGYPEAYG
jgi:hypothetical protein